MSNVFFFSPQMRSVFQSSDRTTLLEALGSFELFVWLRFVQLTSDGVSVVLLLPSAVICGNPSHCAGNFVPLLDVEHGGDVEEESFSSHNIDISHKSQYLRRLTLKGRE